MSQQVNDPLLPVIILVRPQMGENIGAAARVMANFGLRELRIVNPRDGWPNPRADALAGHALEVVQQATLYATTQEAVADLQVTFATSARDRDMRKPVMEPHEAMEHVTADRARGVRTGIIFGPERTGLENDDMASADAILTMPTDAACPSINLSHAVGIVAYAWSRTGGRPVPQPVAEKEGAELPASKADIEGMFAHLEGALDAMGYWKEPTKKPYMWKNIRATLMRAQMTAGEVQTWRGIIRALAGR